MNIYEALKKSSKVKLPKSVTYDLDKGNLTVLFNKEMLLSEDWEPVIEPLTFERVERECVPGKTLLLHPVDNKPRLYLGFNRDGNIVTDFRCGGDAICWFESEIKNWKISSEVWEG